MKYYSIIKKITKDGDHLAILNKRYERKISEDPETPVTSSAHGLAKSLERSSQIVRYASDPQQVSLLSCPLVGFRLAF